MSSTESSSPPSIRVVIIGGNVGGLASAISFRRSGHQAVVLECRDSIAPEVTGGIRLPPNITKIIYQWGYEELLRRVAVKSSAIDLRLMDTGEKLGGHVWEEQLIRDARGDFMFTHHGDFVRFLHDIAEDMGAELHYSAKVVDVNMEDKIVTLEDGRVFEADVIVGADGVDGISRPLFEAEEPEPLLNFYSTTIPMERILSDPLTADLHNENKAGLCAAWFGDGVAVLGWPLMKPEYALCVYGPPVGDQTGWLHQGKKDRMMEILNKAEPRLRKLGEWAREPHVVTVNKTIPLEEWFHDDGPYALVGHAAQPLAAGSIQEAATAFEDGVALGRIFSRIKNYDQISTYLIAYEEIRRDRDIRAYEKELEDIQFMCLPPQYAAARDNVLREKGKDGRNIFELEIPDDPTESEAWVAWEKIVDQFAYNAEEAADDWWHKTGKTIQASQGGIVDAPLLQIVVAKTHH
ncbi:hypothetical protein AGABI2DRAFT_191047 [Agaricus bisporus var. bisporus H97]|uniref:hypothetical protein n=1 Tax=Agaricus bisporus var. bisporus (strain H97 / ATCC MYA-4626 / FGSC 10389) TaxID=936046 RepID=UPI00029F7CDC|nr:hypothetical protein AGABI2DRAFT_191047 [Agaricus bisporus var. bisporus H97]EKV48853.1 hypothetical protein AGABI2DRAFT_191047 [Agaricus bisporus var. bisporus H97]